MRAILTHCNTGPLATGGCGTALGVIIAAHRAGKKPRVFVGETRPLLQGARLNYLELRQAGVDAVLIVDAAAAVAMKAAPDRSRHRRRRSHRAQRRHREQDRHVCAGDFGGASWHPILRCGAALDVRSDAGQRRCDPD